MKLELGTFRVEEMNFGSKTSLAVGCLNVDTEALKRLVLEDSHFRDVAFHIASPGERVRIIHALDIVEPRHKVSGPGGVFPGVLGPAVSVGQGRTNRLEQVAVVTAGPPVRGEMTYSREAIIDMSGPGARYTPFSATINLVVELKPETALSEEDAKDLAVVDSVHGSKLAREYNWAARVAGFKVAAYLAEATRGMEPDWLDTYELTPTDPTLPKIVYAPVIYLQYLYGLRLGWQPTLLYPNELMDGVLFGSYNMTAGMRDCSYINMNHPIVMDLYSQHGKSLNFLGVALNPVGYITMEAKERVTDYSAKLLRMLGAQGAILTFFGAGQTSVDVMMLCRKCEELGIRTAILYPEMSRTPEEIGFSHYVPEADAIVSTGGYEREITLPPMDRVIGGTHLLEGGLDASGSLKVPIRLLYASASPVGASTLAGVQY